jgi:hypothetical protein
LADTEREAEATLFRREITLAKLWEIAYPEDEAEIYWYYWFWENWELRPNVGGWCRDVLHIEPEVRVEYHDDCVEYPYLRPVFIMLFRAEMDAVVFAMRWL